MNAIFSTLASALKTAAPTLATMLGGPLAGTAVTALESVFGLTANADKSVSANKILDILKSGAMTPDQIAALKAADLRHTEVMGQQGIDVLKINADHDLAFAQTEEADRDSARKLEMAQPSLWPGILSLITTAAVLGVIAARMAGENLPQDATTTQLIGSLTTGWGMALAYWFGTTRSSSEKNNLLAQSMPVIAK